MIPDSLKSLFILKNTARAFGLSVEDILKKDRSAEIYKARVMVARRLRSERNLSISLIAKFLDRDPSTILRMLDEGLRQRQTRRQREYHRRKVEDRCLPLRKTLS